MSVSFRRAALPIALAASVLALVGCGGGESEPEAVTVTETVTDTGSTDTEGTDTTETETVPAEGTIFGLGETATWSGDEFVVSDVETSDEEPDLGLGSEQEQAEGVWVIFTITTPERNVIWTLSSDQPKYWILGGDGVYYEDEVYTNQLTQDAVGEDNFLVWVDVPEEAVSGADLVVSDSLGLYMIDTTPENQLDDEGYPDPAYATRVDLGL